MRVFTLDNTFGYNPGRAGLAFSLAGKLAIVQRLDRLGIDYIEAGTPATHAKFFDYARSACALAHSRLVASLRLDAVRDATEYDPEIRAVLESGAPVAAVSANTGRPLGPDPDEYRRKIGVTIYLLQARGLEVIFRDEDFFRVFLGNSVFALHTLEAAKAAGAQVLCLGDSSGAGDPQVVRETAIEVRKRFEGVLGICAHDDSDLALANTLEAVDQGFTHVEGSINSYGARRGLANLCSIISSLEHKMVHNTIGTEKLDEMAEVARAVAEAEAATLARRVQASTHATRVGEAVLQVLDPHLLHGIPERRRRALLEQVEAMEAEGYDLRQAGGTLELLARDALHPEIRPFVAERYELTSHSGLYGGGRNTATATIRAGDHVRSETEDGDGAVNALERALRQCLFALYPEIAKVHMLDYKVKPLEPAAGTLSRARVSLTWTDGQRQWVTAAVAKDIVEATWLALVDGFRLPLMLPSDRGHPVPEPADSSWAV